MKSMSKIFAFALSLPLLAPTMALAVDDVTLAEA